MDSRTTSASDMVSNLDHKRFSPFPLSSKSNFNRFVLLCFPFRNATGVPQGTPGMITLGYLIPGSSNEHLGKLVIKRVVTDYSELFPNLKAYKGTNFIHSKSEYTLAKGFDLSQGEETILLPKGLKPRNSYIVVLFGDSGNASPPFSIVAAKKKRNFRHKRGKKIET